MTDHNVGQNAPFLALLPLKNIVILPKSITPLIVGRPSSIRAVEHSLKYQKHIFIAAQKNADIENPTEQDIFTVGTRAQIVQVMRMPKGTLKLVVEGLARAKVTSYELCEGFLGVHSEDLPSTSSHSTTELEALWRYLQSLFTTYAQHNSKAPADLLTQGATPEEMDVLTDTLALHLQLSFLERQELLEMASLKSRLLRLCKFLQKEIEIAQTEERIRGKVQDSIEKNQREYYLTEQMKAIQHELGRDDVATEVEAIRTKSKHLGLSQDAYEKLEKELRRLEQMPPLSAEGSVSRTYIEWLIALPWNKLSKDAVSLEQAEKILNKKHAGLKKPKEHIIEFLAAKKYSQHLEKTPIVCLVGPPGVGKTSLAQSVADSLGRELIRISLGGVRDEAEVRGHRRTYIGAMPGKIIQALRKAKTRNPVILLDEIDKMTSDAHGDPSAALLEVLDPEQNKNFVDHYIDTPFDLSKVLFLATANMIDGIPHPLYDRMEIISLPGYTDNEKIAIAQDFLIPKNLKEYGLKKNQCIFSEEILLHLITSYTKEAGVRQLERTIAKILRKAIQKFLTTSAKKVIFTPELIREWLGYPKFKKTQTDLDQKRIGIVTGLAWTELGGDILEVEATVLPGKGGLTLTGQLGEVMQESAQAALSYIRSRSNVLGLKNSFYSNKDIHIHIPEGATPKDGPSAGTTMCVALISALTKNPVKPAIAMTGEITLRGRVLGVGGLKEKILAAKHHGVKEVFVPQENFDEIEEIRSEFGDDITLTFIEHMDDLLKRALIKTAFSKTIKIKPARKTALKKNSRSNDQLEV